MAGLESWSTTPASNNAAPPDGAPEGMAPSGVNDVMRNMMAAIRTWFEDAAWTDLGHTPVFIDADTFRIVADVQTIYKVGRRVRLYGATMGTVTGTITAVSYGAPNTDIDVEVDDGTSLDNSLEQVYVSALADGLAIPPTIFSEHLYGDASASATDAFNLSLTYPIGSLTAGLEVTFTVPELNTGAVTLDVQGLGAKNLYNSDLTDLDVGDLRPGGIVSARYDGSAFVAVAGVLPDKVGTVKPWTTDTAPNGWLLCDGSEISRTTYAALFAKIGETFGVGDGSTTFNIPDLRGRTVIGLDNMGGTSANRVTGSWADALAGASGAETHTLTVAEMPVHSHTYSAHLGLGGNDASTGVDVRETSQSTGTAGSGQAHNNMQPSMALNYVIRT